MSASFEGSRMEKNLGERQVSKCPAASHITSGHGKRAKHFQVRFLHIPFLAANASFSVLNYCSFRYILLLYSLGFCYVARLLSDCTFLLLCLLATSLDFVVFCRYSTYCTQIY
ncbi:hypothetical protein GYMLUDRAFT_615949 [Collybiopsis luxurians FD-317 M1]|uniref:Uncharacterized protein n=1 Tax=Collybiopsis luxurians FD-317 M1 TaxID=944289 RepID=A0A0D0BX52_9AGAR|nr:hypothetical protein GYMLUDRAFT_615949 [Collybiopsis luxurians FD-317 M1]